MTMCGTMWYIAPESLEGHVQKESDVWSLGMTVHEMCSGCRPWDHLSGQGLADVGILFRVSQGLEHPIPNEFPRNLHHFLGQALQFDPNMRASCHDLLNHPFILSDEV